VNDKGAFRSHVFQNIGEHFGELRIVDAQKLRGGACGIGERPQHVEDGADADFAPRTDGVFHRAVQFRREEKADADLLEAFLDDFLIDADVDAQGFENVGAAAAAGDGAVAVLGDDDARRRHDKRRRRGNVERAQFVAAGAAGIDDGSRAGVDARGFLAHDARRAGHFLDRLPFHSERGDERTDLRRRGVAVHDFFHRRHHFFLRKIDSSDGPVNGFPDHICCSFLRMFFKKLRKMRLPCGVSTDSGWN